MCVSGGLWRTGGEFFTEKLNILWNPNFFRKFVSLERYTRDMNPPGYLLSMKDSAPFSTSRVLNG
jgi:hypothetical protein